MALFGKGVVWKINQLLYRFRKWYDRNWQWLINAMISVAAIFVAYYVGLISAKGH